MKVSIITPENKCQTDTPIDLEITVQDDWRNLKINPSQITYPIAKWAYDLKTLYEIGKLFIIIKLVNKNGSDAYCEYIEFGKINTDIMFY